jgi:sulfate transport system ATP-binding protein
MTRIEVDRLSKRYGRAIAVEDVSFAVESGELCALLGPSGSGKSTVLRLIAGLERPTAGDVRLDGFPVGGMPPHLRGVGFVFQSYALFRHRDVFENVAFGLRIRHEPVERVSERVHGLLEQFGLAGLAHRMPHELSGGERQRVAIARALAVRPQVLLLDEPFGALDAKIRSELQEWLRSLHDELHITSIFVTHDQEEAASIADRVVVMASGRVEQVGAPRAVYDRPATDFVADFIGPMNTFSAVVLGGYACAGEFKMEVQPGIADGSQVIVRIRPHDVELGGWLRGMRGQIRRASFLGALVRVEVQLAREGPLLTALLPRREADRIGVEAGRRARVRVRAGRVTPIAEPPPGRRRSRREDDTERQPRYEESRELVSP